MANEYVRIEGFDSAEAPAVHIFVEVAFYNVMRNHVHKKQLEHEVEVEMIFTVCR